MSYRRNKLKTVAFALETNDGCHDAPSLELVLSNDSPENSAFPYDELPFNKSQRPGPEELKRDVHSCKSSTCHACRAGAKPRFVPASTKIAPARIRRMPLNWWNGNFDNDSLFEKVSEFLSMIEQEIPCAVRYRDRVDSPSDEEP